MSRRITRADIAVQVAMLESYARSVKLIDPTDSLRVIHSGSGIVSLAVAHADSSGLSTFAPLGAGGVLGTTAREAFSAAHVMQETLWNTCQALGIQTTYPTEKIAQIRGEK